MIQNPAMSGGGDGTFNLWVGGLSGHHIVVNGVFINTTNATGVGDKIGPAYQIPILKTFSYGGKSYGATVAYNERDIFITSSNTTPIKNGMDMPSVAAFNPTKEGEFILSFTID